MGVPHNSSITTLAQDNDDISEPSAAHDEFKSAEQPDATEAPNVSTSTESATELVFHNDEAIQANNFDIDEMDVILEDDINSEPPNNLPISDDTTVSTVILNSNNSNKAVNNAPSKCSPGSFSSMQKNKLENLVIEMNDPKKTVVPQPKKRSQLVKTKVITDNDYLEELSNSKVNKTKTQKKTGANNKAAINLTNKQQSETAPHQICTPFSTFNS